MRGESLVLLVGVDVELSTDMDDEGRFRMLGSEHKGEIRSSEFDLIGVARRIRNGNC